MLLVALYAFDVLVIYKKDPQQKKSSSFRPQSKAQTYKNCQSNCLVGPDVPAKASKSQGKPNNH